MSATTKKKLSVPDVVTTDQEETHNDADSVEPSPPSAAACNGAHRGSASTNTSLDFGDEASSQPEPEIDLFPGGLELPNFGHSPRNSLGGERRNSHRQDRMNLISS